MNITVREHVHLHPDYAEVTPGRYAGYANDIALLEVFFPCWQTTSRKYLMACLDRRSDKLRRRAGTGRCQGHLSRVAILSR